MQLFESKLKRDLNDYKIFNLINISKSFIDLIKFTTG